MASDKIKVAVRVRPFNRREVELGAACVVEMEPNRTVLYHLGEKEMRKLPKSFTYDHCFNSLDPAESNFTSQDDVFECVGRDILDNAFKGYNACILAYGQTGSGKSYTMMGSRTGPEAGIIPRLCDSLFCRINEMSAAEQETKVEVSYMEIYNEKVFDLLDLTSPCKSGLKVREHNVLGPYVDGLSQLAVISYQEIEDLMIEGNKSRTVASTNMNNESSRSHAVFTVILTFTLKDPLSGVTGEKVSRISLVDLAGSERAVKTGAVGERLKEGSNINKSLTTLGLVISKLSDQASGKAKDKFVPYRDSALTWLLKDNLGGNSKTVMVATISPALDNYEETLSTLRYADRAKRIVNHAVVNEDPNARIIRELRAEVDALKEMLLNAAQPAVLREKLSENEKLMKEMSLTWEEKLHKTEQMQEDRRHALEKMGISVQSSGIKVEKNKYFLVNLNDDPSLNELLVYYLSERTLVGRPEASLEQDIQLCGLGIQSEHAVIEAGSGDLHITPLPGARTCVNGVEITSRTQMYNGDRLLWGSNHFFRVNCPRAANGDFGPATPFDWRMAQEEVMMAEVENAPMREAMAKLERQYEEDKQTALENQRKEYEKQFQQLKSFMSPSTPYAPYTPHDPFRSAVGKPVGTPSTPNVTSRLERWGQQRDDTFKRGLAKLRGEIIRANGLAREANWLAAEMGRGISFGVTLQIPPHNLTPSRRTGAFVSEPAILVKREGKGSQVWPLEKLVLKLIDMREVYEEVKSKKLCFKDVGKDLADPFYQTAENQNLIGVANLFLGVLFHDVALSYQTPIISQQGEVSGRLCVEIERTSGSLPELATDPNLSGTVSVRLTIKAATSLPPSLSHMVFCQYMFWGDCDITTVQPLNRSTGSDSFTFEHSREIQVSVSEEFLEHCSEGALSIEVYGHRTSGAAFAWQAEEQLAKARCLADRWGELSRKLEVGIEVQELAECGEYQSVEVVHALDSGCGGVLQLRQGQQRRLVARVKPVAESGTLPIICQAVTSIAVGSPCIRSRLQRPLDSYQEEDLASLREHWSGALDRRREYLNGQIQRSINKASKNDIEGEREQALVDQWVRLTDERNAVIAPTPGSGIPGAPPVEGVAPTPGRELHSPVIFLNLNADDLSTGQETDDFTPVYGLNSILPKELAGKFFSLPLVAIVEEGGGVGGLASWDSSIHDSSCLNRITQSSERAYLIVKVVVRLSHPASMELVLRKRLCFSVVKRQSLAEKLKRKLGQVASVRAVSVRYEIVSNVPKASAELEDRESLAVAAASVQDQDTEEGETFIERYSKGVSAVETILLVDRLRQQVAVKEKLASSGLCKREAMRKTMSMPNFVQMSQSVSFDNISSMQMRSSCSFQDGGELSSRRKTLGGGFPESASSRSATAGGESVSGMSRSFTLETVPEAAEGDTLARPTFLNLGLNLTSQAKDGRSSPCNRRLPRQGMTTVHEEKVAKSDNSNDKAANGEELASQQMAPTCSLPASRTCDSLHELAAPKLPSGGSGPPGNSPSLVSSGYGSQAASSTNLSSEDSLSLKSISVDETPETEVHKVEKESEVFLESSQLDGKSSSSTEPGLLLSPPDISTASASPGEETDHTVTEASSTTVTPSQSIELPHRLSPQLDDPVHLRANGQLRGSRGQRASCPAEATERETGSPVQRTCRRSVPEPLKGESGSESCPEWLKVGESIQLRPSNQSGVISYLGPTQFAAGLWVGVELDTVQGKHNGTVQGVRYFSCPPKRGIFVRPKTLKVDKRGREMRARRRKKENDGVVIEQIGDQIQIGSQPRQSSAGKMKMRQK